MKPLLCCLLVSLLFACSVRKPSGPVLNHIALYVKDLQRSTDFYRVTIGLDTIPEPFRDGRHTWFTIGQGHLHLISGARTGPLPEKNTHLCFSTADMEGFIGRLKAATVSYEDWAGTKNAITTRVDGIKQIYFQDPDGYWIEV